MPKLTKVLEMQQKKRMKNCKKCGKPFLGYAYQLYCHDPCVPEGDLRKTKTYCEICGRHIKSRIPIDSLEKALCSFCEKRISHEKQEQREKARHRDLRKCEVCGKIDYLVPYKNICYPCNLKKLHPEISTIQEVSP
jgi:ribosomal protein S14